MRKKIYRSIMLLSITSLFVCGAALCMVFYNQLSNTVRADLRERAITMKGIVKDIVVDKNNGYASLKVADMRVTVIGADGSVLYDDDESIADMGNHSNREEINEASTYGVGESKRFSDTLGRETYYYAVKLHNGDILRLAKTTSSIFGMLTSIVPLVILVIIAVVLISYLFAARLTRNIVAPINEIDPASAMTVPYDELVPFARTIRKQKEQIDAQFKELQGHADTVSAIMDNMREGIALIDKQGTILSANKSALSIFEFNEDVQGRNIIELLRNLELHNHILDALSGEHSEAAYEHTGRVYQVFFSPAANSGAIILLLDITERASAEKIRKEFSANVSHELKTPLSSITAYAEMIVSGMAKNTDVIGFVEKIKDEAVRLIALVEDIIMLSELDEDYGISESETVDLAEIAKEVSNTLALKASEMQVTVNTDIRQTLVAGSRSMLYEMLYNLVDNGIKYNKPGGGVNLSVSAVNGRAILSVSDTGIGIPKEHQHRVFERFYRVDKSRSKKTGGTGLGLSIVKHIAAVHSGTVELKSLEGKGTTIIVKLAEKL